MTKEFFKLLKYSNELEKEKKFLSTEDPEKFELLLKFSVIIENNFQYAKKQEYIELAIDFMDGEITAEDFSSSFQTIYEGINPELSKMERNESLELAHFLEPNRLELGKLLASIYGSCDSFSLDPNISMCDEKELKECAENLLLKLQE